MLIASVIDSVILSSGASYRGSTQFICLYRNGPYCVNPVKQFVLLQLKSTFISSHRLLIDSHSFLRPPLFITVAQEKPRVYGRPLIKAQTPSCDCPSFQPQLRQSPQKSQTLRESPNPPLRPKRPPLSVNDFPGPDLDLALTLISRGRQ
jgi:hypothetical protein